MSRFFSWAFMMSQRGRGSSDESSASSPFFPILILRLNETAVTETDYVYINVRPVFFYGRSCRKLG